jgi:hypothetical protein
MLGKQTFKHDVLLVHGSLFVCRSRLPIEQLEDLLLKVLDVCLFPLTVFSRIVISDNAGLTR